MVSGMNSIMADWLDVIRISYGRKYSLCVVLRNSCCKRLISCIAITSWRQSSFALTIMGLRVYVLRVPYTLLRRYASRVFFHLSLNGSFKKSGGRLYDDRFVAAS